MEKNLNHIVKNLVLIGGGHSHVIVLKMLGMKPLPGVKITLITETSYTPYSGMLPGHIAGFYNFNECHIDLRSLTEFAQAKLCLDHAIGLDLKNQQVICANLPPISFDLLSIDIGSTPAKISIPGAAEYAIAAKPVGKLLAAWNQLIETVVKNPENLINIGIVGGGAGGVEIALSMQYFLEKILGKNLKIHLFDRHQEIMPNHNIWVRQTLKKIMINRGINLHLGENVSAIQPGIIYCQSGLKIECNNIFLVTQASAPNWLKESGLATDSSGFIQVNNFLQSISHPQIFAAGDIATMINHPRPKTGVLAVRQGKPLFINLRCTLLEKPLKNFIPQTDFLGLIGTGDGQAIASRGYFGYGPSPLLWQWKNFIDRKFMQKFTKFPKPKQ